MNREDIIKLAREVGLTDESFERDWYVFQLERFAALVAAASASVEREACAKLCGELHLEGEDDTGLAADMIRARGETK